MNTIETTCKIETYRDAIDFLLQDIPHHHFETRAKLTSEFNQYYRTQKLSLIESLEQTLDAKIIVIDDRFTAEIIEAFCGR